MRTTRLTIYLLRNVSEPAEAIDPEKTPNSIPLDANSNFGAGNFYYESRPATTPAWVAFVSPLLASAVPATLKTSSASGVLILQAKGRFFALTFGYGRGLLDMSKIEHQFGLRVALNRIDPKQIRSLDTKTFEDMVVTRNTQSSKSSELPTFGVDVSRDILRAVTGEPRDTTFAKRLSGADALVVNLSIAPNDLPKLCGDLLDAFAEDTYKTDFEWIDHLAQVNDQNTVIRLNDLLVQDLASGDTTNTHMAVLESIDWGDIDAFKIGGTRAREYDDLDLGEYLDALADERKKITIDVLKSRRVSVRFGRASDFDPRWSVYQCLVTEQRLDSKLHVLIEGRWFVVSDSLVSQVDDFAASLPSTATALIDARAGETEADYNARLASSAPAKLLLLDAHIKRPGGASSGIELCDVMTSDGEFIHVKRKTRSSTLSHLFAQGTISATTFNGDGDFRHEMRKVITSVTTDPQREEWLQLVPDAGQAVDKTKYSISYAVVANSTRTGTDWLPFFSKLNLMQSGKQLQNLGFRVAISRVPVKA